MAFSQKQFKSIIESTSRINIWDGSVRSGKTFASIWRWFDFVKNAPKTGSLLMAGKTHKALQRNVLEPIEEMLGKRRCKYNRGTGEFTLLGRKCDLIGANDERAQDQIRGSTVAGAYCDEITLFPESFWTMLLSRLSVKGAKLFGTTNPDSPFHWLKTGFLDRDDLSLKRFHFVIDDNTNLDPEYVASIKKEYTGLWYKRFIEGLWVMADGVIYDMFDEGRHLVDVAEVLKSMKRTEFGRQFLAIDYGTAHPFAAGLFGYNGAKPPVYLQREYYYDSKKGGRQKTDREYLFELNQWLKGVKPSYVYVDPNAKSFIATLRKAGYYVVEAENSVIDGIRFVGNMFSSDQFFIDKHHCPMSRKEMSSYVWDQKAQTKGEDKPVKQSDHCMDMIRYGLFTHFFKMFPVRIEAFNLK